MNISKKVCGAILCAAVAMLLGDAEARAQNLGVASRVAETVDDTRTVRLQGNVHPLAKPVYDQGALADSQPLTRMMLLLQRSSEQETALRQLLDEQQTKGSANFHAWLTPEQFGKQFGPSDADVQVVTDWLTRQGFSIGKISTGRTVIEFSGNVSQVRNAFHTELHHFTVNGEEHFANVSDPAIPSALAPVVKGVVALHNFRKKSLLSRVGKFRRDLKSGQITPLFTFNDINGTFYAVGPADFATIYHIPAGADGAGQSIALVGRSNILIKDVQDFRSMFGLSAKDPQIILNGPDPGLVSGDESESDLDVEWAGAVAPAAQIILVATEGTQTDGVDGVDASSLYIVDNNVAPVMSNSYSSCESNLGSGGNGFYSALWQQAAAEGITVFVPAGDSGAAGCDDQNTQATATRGVGVNGLASTPYNVAVGGTDFNQVNNQSAYWNANGDGSNLYPSAKGYIPELPWNDSCAGTSNSSVTSCASATASSGLDIVGGGGGPSGVYAKPAWQTGTGVPGDGVRDIPDVSLFASDGGLNGLNKSFYVICESDAIIPGDTGCNLTSRSNSPPFHDFQAVGGTSAAAPTFAGIMALVNQKTGQRQGNANYVLYHLATVAPTAFHDITSGNNSVACTGASPNCSTTNASNIGVLTTATGGNTLAFAAGVAYDLATGLGSVDVTNLLNNWAAPSFKLTSTNLTSVSPTNSTVDAAVAIKGTVTGAGTPTGVVVLQNAATGAPLDSFTLDASGTFNAWTTTFLPGGSYSVEVHYGGDGNFGPSDSAATPIKVTPQGSKVVVSWVGANNTLSQSSQNVQYGSPYILRIDVANGSGVPCQNIATGTVGFVCPTGTVTLFQNTGVPLNDFPPTNGAAPANVSTLNDRGFAEDQPIQLASGSYSITATYSGDASYSAQASSNALGVTITQATTTASVNSNLNPITTGQIVILTATISSNSNSTQGPTGMVQFKSGGASLGNPVACTALGATASAGASCTVTLPPTAISALYPPPASGPKSPVIPVIVALLSVLLFALGWRWMPERRRRAYAYAGLVAFALLAVGIAGCGGGGGGNRATTRAITAVYAGDTNYKGSTSPALTITLN